MGLKVDEDYYCNVCDYYKKQITMLEDDLEAFRAVCDGLFLDNNYGDNVQRVLMARANNFYEAASTTLSSFIDEASTVTETFLDNVETDDVLS